MTIGELRTARPPVRSCINLPVREAFFEESWRSAGELVRDQLKWAPVKRPITRNLIESITFIGSD
jgi:hypothetical protein